MNREKRSARFQRYAVPVALILVILALWFHDIRLMVNHSP